MVRWLRLTVREDIKTCSGRDVRRPYRSVRNQVNAYVNGDEDDSDYDYW